MRVLLAQTDRNAVEIFRTALKAAGHEVIVAKSGEQVIRRALEERPDVIVTELVLPMVDGWRVAQVLGSYGPMKNVPLLALTSHVAPDGRTEARAAGFTEYLTLPIEPRDLVEALEQAVGGNDSPVRTPGAPRARRRARPDRGPARSGPRETE